MQALTKISKYNLTDAIYQTKGKITLERKSRHKKASNFKALECAVVCAQKSLGPPFLQEKPPTSNFPPKLSYLSFRQMNFNFYEPPYSSFFKTQASKEHKVLICWHQQSKTTSRKDYKASFIKSLQGVVNIALLPNFQLTNHKLKKKSIRFSSSQLTSSCKC